MVLGGVVPFVGPQENYAAQEYTQGVYFEPRAGGEEGFSGFITTNKQTKKQKHGKAFQICSQHMEGGSRSIKTSGRFRYQCRGKKIPPAPLEEEYVKVEKLISDNFIISNSKKNKYNS